jgi:hypothetical protein
LWPRPKASVLTGRRTRGPGRRTGGGPSPGPPTGGGWFCPLFEPVCAPALAVCAPAQTLYIIIRNLRSAGHPSNDAAAAQIDQPAGRGRCAIPALAACPCANLKGPLVPGIRRRQQAREAGPEDEAGSGSASESDAEQEQHAGQNSGEDDDQGAAPRSAPAMRGKRRARGAAEEAAPGDADAVAEALAGLLSLEDEEQLEGEVAEFGERLARDTSLSG